MLSPGHAALIQGVQNDINAHKNVSARPASYSSSSIPASPQRGRTDYQSLDSPPNSQSRLRKATGSSFEKAEESASVDSGLSSDSMVRAMVDYKRGWSPAKKDNIIASITEAGEMRGELQVARAALAQAYVEADQAKETVSEYEQQSRARATLDAEVSLVLSRSASRIAVLNDTVSSLTALLAQAQADKAEAAEGAEWARQCMRDMDNEAGQPLSPSAALPNVRTVSLEAQVSALKSELTHATASLVQAREEGRQMAAEKCALALAMSGMKEALTRAGGVGGGSQPFPLPPSPSSFERDDAVASLSALKEGAERAAGLEGKVCRLQTALGEAEAASRASAVESGHTISSLRAELKRAKEDGERSCAEASELRTRLSSLHEEAKGMSAALDGLTSEMGVLRSMSAGDAPSLVRLQAEVDVLTHEVDSMKAERDSARKENTAAGYSMNSLRQVKAGLERHVAELEAQLAERVVVTPDSSRRPSVKSLPPMSVGKGKVLSPPGTPFSHMSAALMFASLSEEDVEAKLIALGEQLATARSDAEATHAEANSAHAEAVAAQRENTSLMLSLTAMKQVKVGMNAHIHEMEEEIESLKGRVSEGGAREEILRGERDRLQAALDLSRAETSVGSASTTALRRDLAKARAEGAQAASSTEALRQLKEGLEAHVAELDSEVAALKGAAESRERELTSAQRGLASLREVKAMLEVRVAELADAAQAAAGSSKTGSKK